MPNLLVTTSTFPASEVDATPRFVLDLASRIAQDEDFRVVILAPRIERSKSYEEIGQLRICRYDYFWPRAWQWLTKGSMIGNIKKNKLLAMQVPFFLRAQEKMAVKLVEKYQIDIIHAHWWMPQGFIATKLKKKYPHLKILCTSHGSDLMALQGLFWDRQKMKVIDRCDRLTVVSREMKNLAGELGCPEEKTAVEPMGVDGEMFGKKTARDIKKELGIKREMILFVGRLSEEKGLRYGLEAFAKIVWAWPEAKMVVIGDGQEKGKLIELAKALRISEKVIFLGGKSNRELPSYYQSADLFIGPSIREGFGLVFVEAMMAGVPVLSSDLESIGEIVQDGKTGRTVAVRDADKFAQAMREMLDDKEDSRRLAENALREARERYDWDRVAERYKNILKAL